jgi:hypothetical protein
LTIQPLQVAFIFTSYGGYALGWTPLPYPFIERCFLHPYLDLTVLFLQLHDRDLAILDARIWSFPLPVVEECDALLYAMVRFVLSAFPSAELIFFPLTGSTQLALLPEDGDSESP